MRTPTIFVTLQNLYSIENSIYIIIYCESSSVNFFDFQAEKYNLSGIYNIITSIYILTAVYSPSVASNGCSIIYLLCTRSSMNLYSIIIHTYIKYLPNLNVDIISFICVRVYIIYYCSGESCNLCRNTSKGFTSLWRKHFEIQHTA